MLNGSFYAREWSSKLYYRLFQSFELSFPLTTSIWIVEPTMRFTYRCIFCHQQWKIYIVKAIKWEDHHIQKFESLIYKGSEMLNQKIFYTKVDDTIKIWNLFLKNAKYFHLIILRKEIQIILLPNIGSCWQIFTAFIKLIRIIKWKYFFSKFQVLIVS